METNKLFVFSLIFIFCLTGISASGNISITEIMYHPEQSDYYNEWIEIYNNGENNLNLSNWTLCGDSLAGGYVDNLDGEEVKNNSGLILESGEYAIITDGSSGTEVYSNFNIDSDSLAFHINSASLCSGLSNSGETLLLKNNQTGENISVSYNPSMGADGNGKSLQYCNGTWVESEPTPGYENNCTIPDEEDENPEENETDYEESSEENETSPKIELNYPSKIGLDQEFEFELKLINFPEDIYDVKIDFSFNDSRISKILNNNTWKSTNYYVNDIINSGGEKMFTIKLVKDFEIANIEIKIRDSSGNIETFSGYNISKNPSEENETKETREDETSQNSYKDENGTIILNPKNNNPKTIKSNSNLEENKDNLAMYGIILFGALMVLLFLLKEKITKSKYKNEFQ